MYVALDWTHTRTYIPYGMTLKSTSGTLNLKVGPITFPLGRTRGRVRVSVVAYILYVGDLT